MKSAAAPAKASLAQLIIPTLIRFEDNVPHFYLDSRGIVTIGIGHRVIDERDACAMKFEIEGQGAHAGATPVWIAAEYERVRDCKSPGKHPEFYRRTFHLELRLTEGWAEQDAIARVDGEFIPAIKRHFAGFDGYPLSAKLALIDMAYNLGAAGEAKFVRLIDACESGRWSAAATESNRVGVSFERNAWTRDQFLVCSTSTKEAR